MAIVDLVPRGGRAEHFRQPSRQARRAHGKSFRLLDRSAIMPNDESVSRTLFRGRQVVIGITVKEFVRWVEY